MASVLRVKILLASYDHKRKLVVFRLQLPDGKALNIANRAEDIVVARKLSRMPTRAEWEKFCSDLKGKDMDWINEASVKDVADIKSMDQDTMQLQSRELNQFPYNEVIDKINKGEL